MLRQTFVCATVTVVGIGMGRGSGGYLVQLSRQPPPKSLQLVIGLKACAASGKPAPHAADCEHAAEVEERDQDDLGQGSKPQAMPSRRQRKRDRKRKAAAMDELSEGEDGPDSHSDAEEVDDAPEVVSDDEPAGTPCWVVRNCRLAV